MADEFKKDLSEFSPIKENEIAKENVFAKENVAVKENVISADVFLENL